MGSFSGSFKCFLKHFNSIKPSLSLLTRNNLCSRSFCEQNKGVNLYTSRSHTCGELSKKDVGKHVTLSGWLEFRRMNKFGILRDAYGTTQIVIPEERKELMKLLDETPLESVVSVEGTVAERPGNQVNKKMSTGEVELIVSEYKLINPVTKQLPFSVREFNKSKESLRLKYRYLDLRYPEAQRRLRARSELLFKMREFLVREAAFVEVETPALFKATPGGAQEFLVPTRFPGEFYSLAQSPQQSKQLLMVGGTDRYFQVAKCFRDETARPDRQPEFTQLDLELSFTSCDGVMSLVEDLLAWSWPGGPPTPLPFPRMPYAEAIQFYGTDKPDLRIDAKIGNLDDLLPEANSDSSLVFPAKWKDVTARGLRVPKGSGLFVGDLKRSVLGLKRERWPDCWLRCLNASGEGAAGWEAAVAKAGLPLPPDSLWKALHLQPGDLALVAIGEMDSVLEMLGKMRMMLAPMAEGEASRHRLLWVVDFPLFLAGGPGEPALVSAHHPFTRPHPDDTHLLRTDPLKVRGLHYDLVMDGCEVGGGSERIHDPQLQETLLRTALRIDPKPLSHLLRALASGAPPHAGIALGVDRLVALMTGANSIRDVMAFPKGSDGRDPLTGAPSPASKADLALYALSTAHPLLPRALESKGSS